MFHLEDVLHLNERERLLGVMRQHPVVLFRRLFWALLLIVVPFFLVFQLISWGMPGTALFVALVLIGACIAVRAVLLWNAHVLIATTDRVVVVRQPGLFSRFVNDIPFTEVQDVQWEKRGLADALFKLGTFVVRQKEKDSEIRFTRLLRPQDFVSIIHEARHPEIVRMKEEEKPVVLTIHEILGCIESLPESDRAELFRKCGIGASRADQELLPVVQKEVADS